MSAETHATSLDLLAQEANRQLTICNSCRYCEGYCAVFPALERRVLLREGDITQLANVCHDCRACYDACMYSPPHDFGVNVPKTLSEVRLAAYERYLWPARVPSFLRGWGGIAVGTATALVLVFGVALAYAGAGRLIASPGGIQSPYDLVPYPVMLTILLLPSAFAVWIIIVAGRSYWYDVGGTAHGVNVPALTRATKYALTLRYLRGGGAECFYPRDDEPSPLRRRLHHLTLYGFLLCVLSTTSAAVLGDILDSPPPYPLISVPVISGSMGGAGLLAGCVGLLVLKVRSSPATSFAQMTVKDYGLLVALIYLAFTGLLTLALRTSSAFGLVFLAHFAGVVLCFAAAPYSKFVHFVYRFLAILKDSLENGQVGVAAEGGVEE